MSTLTSDKQVGHPSSALDLFLHPFPIYYLSSSRQGRPRPHAGAPPRPPLRPRLPAFPGWPRLLALALAARCLPTTLLPNPGAAPPAGAPHPDAATPCSTSRLPTPPLLRLPASATSPRPRTAWRRAHTASAGPPRPQSASTPPSPGVQARQAKAQPPRRRPAANRPAPTVPQQRSAPARSLLPLGATKFTYAPEPFDVGRLLQAEIVLNADEITVQTDGPIDNDYGRSR